MKSCVNCGCQAKEEVIFCPKCSTKFCDPIQEKLDKLLKYDIIIDTDLITWDYLREDAERSVNIIMRLDNLRLEMSGLILEILYDAKKTSITKNAEIEPLLYKFVLNMGYNACVESCRLLSNYSGLKEIYDQRSIMYNKGCISADELINDIRKADYIYKAVAGFQAANAVKLIENLDNNVIASNHEYQEFLWGVAQAFNDFWRACSNRFMNFFSIPSKDFIFMNWKVYSIITKGLPQRMINTLDESCWTMFLDYLT